MALRRRRITISDNSAHDLGLGSSYARVFRIDVDTSADTACSAAIVDDNGDTVATIASGDYTTRTVFYVTPVETRVFDTGGDAMADAEGPAQGVVAVSPLTITFTNLGSGTVVVDVFCE